MTLDSHELLFNLVVKLTYPIARIASRLGINGVLRKNLGYTFDMEVFREEYHEIFQPSFHPPDGFIRNLQKEISITVECKSGFTQEKTNLDKQLLFYSESEKFKEIFINENEKNEILIVCFDRCSTEIVHYVKDISLTRNLVVWEVSEIENDNYFLKKIYGNHIDSELDNKMSKGVIEEALTTLFYTSPNISIPILVHEVGKRMLTVLMPYKESINVEDFIEKNCDFLAPSKKKIKRAIKFFLILVQEIGMLSKDKRKIFFKKRPHLENVQKKMDYISSLTTKELEICIRIGTLDMDVVKKKEKPVPYETLDKWLNDKEDEETESEE